MGERSPFLGERAKGLLTERSPRRARLAERGLGVFADRGRGVAGGTTVVTDVTDVTDGRGVAVGATVALVGASQTYVRPWIYTRTND